MIALCLSQTCTVLSTYLWERVLRNWPENCQVWRVGRVINIDSAISIATCYSIRAAMADQCSTHTRRRLVCRCSTDEVFRILRTVPAKHCLLDPVLTWLVKKLAEDIIPVICHLCNISLECCRLPDDQKLAVVRPRLKKPTLDASELNSYHPISNLSFLSKLVKRKVTARYTTHAE